MNPSEYKKFITDKINKALNDEMTSSISYLKMANELQGINMKAVSTILLEHADEEYSHYKEILEYAVNHNIKPIFDIDLIKINSTPTDLMKVISFTQTLEKEAIADYLEISKVALENSDIETQEFFEDILEDEHHHFDELAPFISQKRELGESSNFKKILFKHKEETK